MNLKGKANNGRPSTFVDTGEHAIRFDASALRFRMYFYTLASGNYSETRRMIVVNNPIYRDEAWPRLSFVHLSRFLYT